MFDVRPVDETGDLDWKKIEKIEKILKLELKELESSINEKTYVDMKDLRPQQDLKQELRKEILNELSILKNRELVENYFKNPEVYSLGKKFKSEKIPFFHESTFVPKKNENFPKQEEIIEIEETPIDKKEQLPAINDYETLENYYASETFRKKYESIEKKKKSIFTTDFSFSDLFSSARFSLNFNPRRNAFNFAVISIVIALLFGGFSLGAKGLKLKGTVLGTSQEGYSSLNDALSSIKNQNYETSEIEFEKSYEKFSEASEDLGEMGDFFIELSRFFPFSSKLSSGKNLVEAGKHIATVGQSLSRIIKSTSSIKNPIGNSNQNEEVSLLEIFQSAKKEMTTVNNELDKIQDNINKVNVADIPEDKQKQFISLKEKIPEITRITRDFMENSEIFTDLLGGNGPRKYLFLFQNNQEMRATGGFIGSYGLMDISDGRIRNFFIDGIFNPDGQLQEKVVPPKPIQKISAAWSLHDSNWFPNFPDSAKEAINFYEKTGGPTADGVITLTPTVMQKLLKVTGPIEMKDYGVTIDSDNFIEKTQYEVEVDYDKEENKPKKILSDLAPVILDKIFNARDTKSVTMTIKALSSGLSEKQILLYSTNNDLQKIISEKGWSGEILKTEKDYLSVINSNINGFKTDGIIDESISHETAIQSDGLVVDTVTITRHHNGGNSEYEWWNKVNADYMRVYVPLGSKLLEVSGQTRETNEPPLDYDKLRFKKDSLVQKEENSITIDENSGTGIYEDSGKTVFANWTYVSPQETMTIKYKYLLPFKVDINENKTVNSYSLLMQKQSGSIGSSFSSDIKFPKDYNVEWSYPENLNKKNNASEINTKLDIDKFIGLVFTKSKAILND